jgi:hypothetical protein
MFRKQKRRPGYHEPLHRGILTRPHLLKVGPSQAWCHIPIIPATQEVEVGRLRLGQKYKTLSQNKIKNKRTEGVAQVVQHLPNKL